MTRAPSVLTSLVKAGFSGLNEAKSRLEVGGFDAGDF